MHTRAATGISDANILLGRRTLPEAENKFPNGEVSRFESKRIAAEKKFFSVASGRRGAINVGLTIVHRSQIVDHALECLVVSPPFLFILFTLILF